MIKSTNLRENRSKFTRVCVNSRFLRRQKFGSINLTINEPNAFLFVHCQIDSTKLFSPCELEQYNITCERAGTIRFDAQLKISGR